MEFDLVFMFLMFALACSLLVEAAPLSIKRASTDAAAKAHISPEVTQSSKQFFKKDYPYDKRPKADPFHFQHPYPVVQDGDDYDRDFVKDENSDNGSWKAQETYDRLRVKLAKEKRELAKALGKKDMEERELTEAQRRHAKEAQARADAAKRAAAAQRRQEDAEKNEKPEDASGDAQKHKGKEEPKVRDSEPKVSAGSSGEEVKDVEVSTEEVEKAMKHLEDCKKQLAEARQHLKDLMKELEEAKAAQSKANTALDAALKKELSRREHHSALKKEVKSEYDEYQAARNSYLKQQTNVEKLEADVKVAAAKVKAMRDAADKDGGVYPTPEEKPRSGAPASRWLWALPLAMLGVCATLA